MNLKLNYKRTALIGFAFFGILLLWQVYDSWCTTMLTDIFAQKMHGMNSVELATSGQEDLILDVQWIVGIIMACDNLAALILLPIFGSLSDRTNTKIGKRMPYILVGTLVSALCFPFIPLFFHRGSVLGMICMMVAVLIFMMMYRNPAVALMPDMTPKPLRAKANGIINIMGYFGGAFASVIGMFLVLSDYITSDRSNIWTIELPFLIASILMIISAFVLFFTVKENKIAEEMKEEMAEGERLAAIEDPVSDDAPMTKANKRMLYAILLAEFLWFMCDNAISTFQANFIFFYLRSSTGVSGTLTIIGGVGSVIGFAIAGYIADKIGRKWTITCGLGLTFVALVIMIFTAKTTDPTAELGKAALPLSMWIVWFIKGFAMSLVHNCSFPMVVELSTNKTIGKFTGFYYAASMAAQTITPVLLGLIVKGTKVWSALPIYASVLMLGSFLVFFFLVKNIKANKIQNAKGLEALGDD